MFYGLKSSRKLNDDGILRLEKRRSQFGVKKDFMLSRRMDFVKSSRDRHRVRNCITADVSIADSAIVLRAVSVE